MLLTAGQHQATLKFWMNGKPSRRMYVLDNCTQLVQDLHLRAGCKLQFYKRPDDRVVCCHLSGALSEVIAELPSGACACAAVCTRHLRPKAGQQSLTC